MWVPFSILFATCMLFSVGVERICRRDNSADTLLPIATLVCDHLACELGDLSPDVGSRFCAGR